MTRVSNEPKFFILRKLRSTLSINVKTMPTLNIFMTTLKKSDKFKFCTRNVEYFYDNVEKI